MCQNVVNANANRPGWCVFGTVFGALYSKHPTTTELSCEMPQQSQYVHRSTSSASCEGFFAAWVVTFLEGVVRKPKRNGNDATWLQTRNSTATFVWRSKNRPTDVLSDRSAASPVFARALLQATDLHITWLILPVVICLFQRLSHACLSIRSCTAKLRMAH